MSRDAGMCQPCLRADRVTPASEVDHIISRAAKGTDDDDNLQAICAECHKAKTAAESNGREWDGARAQRIGVDGWPA